MWEVRLRSTFRVDRPLHRIKGQLCYLFEGFSCVLLSSDPRDPKGYLSVSTEDGFWQSAAVSAGLVPIHEGILRSGANEPHRSKFVLWLGWVRANKRCRSGSRATQARDTRQEVSQLSDGWA